MPRHPLDKPHPLSRTRDEQKRAKRRKARLESSTSVPAGCALSVFLVVWIVAVRLVAATVCRRT